ncbi:MAG: flotillin family protein [Planctomycetes bacterium]|jgi:flotillin|nr:flotillin family protein [Planctomycetota bacterium]
MVAQSPSPEVLFAMFAAISVAFFAMAVTLFVTRFKRCPSNKLLVVFGQGIPGGMRVQHGGARLVWPLIQDFGFLSLEPITAPFSKESVFTRESIRVIVAGEVVLAVGTSPSLMQAAAERLLGFDEPAIRRVGQDECAAALRELAGQLTVEMIHRDRERLGEELKKMLDERLARYGLEVVNVRIGEISDDGGVIAAFEQETRERLESRAREDATLAEQRKREEAEFLARRAEAEAELAARHQREIEEEERRRKAPPDVLKDDPGESLKNM